MDTTEWISMIGFPARALGRLPLIARYATGRSASLDAARPYCLARFGKSYRWRPWLLFDTGELLLIEKLINNGSDDEIMAFRTAQVANGASTTVVVSLSVQAHPWAGTGKPLDGCDTDKRLANPCQGSLLASACATMLTLDTLSDVNLTIRALFIIALMLSLMAVYFALVQQREISLGTNAATVRLWLWNGRMRTITTTIPAEGNMADENPKYRHGSEERAVKESSLAANIVLQAPYELLSISISVFLGALIAYLGLAMSQHVKLGTGPLPTNSAAFAALLICTVFTLCVFGQALGQKDKERVVAMPVQDHGEAA